jgi:hypothetical protein
LLVIVVTSFQVVVELRAEEVGMNDARWCACRDCDEFQEAAVSISTDHEQPHVTLKLILDESDGVEPRVLDVGVR